MFKQKTQKKISQIKIHRITMYFAKPESLDKNLFHKVEKPSVSSGKSMIFQNQFSAQSKIIQKIWQKNEFVKNSLKLNNALILNIT